MQPQNQKTARKITLTTVFLALLMCALMAGFFYAYYVSAMWGLDDAPAEAAILAMQGINRLVRNWVFFITFFLPVAVLALAAFMAFSVEAKVSAALLASSSVFYLFGVVVFTSMINVPMNDALALVDVSAIENHSEVWIAYSEGWQFYNAVRMVNSMIVTGLVALAFRWI